MKRLKVVIPNSPTPGSPLNGLDVKLCDADTGEQLECVENLRLNAPVDGFITVTADMLVSEIEISSD